MKERILFLLAAGGTVSAAINALVWFHNDRLMSGTAACVIGLFWIRYYKRRYGSLP